jgi:hypothetical protein
LRDIMATDPTIATTATVTATTRQKLSLRRIRRRSTMVSASSDIGPLLKNSRQDTAADRGCGQWRGRPRRKLEHDPKCGN